MEEANKRKWQQQGMEKVAKKLTHTQKVKMTFSFKRKI